MTRKRLAALLLAAALCLSLTACGEAPVETTLPPETTAAPTEATIPTESTIPTETPAETLPPEPADEELVAVAAYIPDILVDLKYATGDNFTGQVIYEFQEAYLRYGTVKKLLSVQKDLRQLGLGLKIWDGFRPVSAQFTLWEVCPDPTYVANPNTGHSFHSRGNTVDVTLVDGNGDELEMPTGFDDFSAKADRDYSDCSQTAAEHAELLEILMEKHGFTGYSGEWWHYSDEVSYPVEEDFTP